MNEIELVFPTKAHEADAMEYRKEHILNGENNINGDNGLDNTENYDEWLTKINAAQTGEIHSFTFFAIRKSDKKLIGNINIRYPYLDYVQLYGHIGYSIRPSERRKGYATMMLKLALEYCKRIGLREVLLTCDKSNIASAKTIIKCAGVFESEEAQGDGELLQRYWIKL
jgi:predicted acetyltransferase